VNKEHTNHMKSTGRMKRVAAALISLAVIAGACSDDEETTSSSDATETSAATETTGAGEETTVPGETCEPATGEPIKFGTTIWTLEIISLNIKLPGIEAAVKRINDCGGVNGRPLEWVYCGAADANEGEACVRDMIDEGVVATVADANLAAEVPSMTILQDAGVPQIDPFANSPESLNSGNVYMMCPPTPIEYAAIPVAMAEKGYTTYYYFAGQTSSAQNSVNAVDGAAAFVGGLENVGRVDVPLTAADYLPQMQATLDAGADIVVPIIAPFMTALVLQSAEQLGEPVKVGLSFGQFSAGQYDEYGDILEGSLLVSCTPPKANAADFPLVQQAYDDIQAYYEESGDEKASPENLSTLAIRAYLSVLAFAQVASSVETVDSASLKAAMDANTEGIDIGLTEPWVTGTPGPEPYTRVFNGTLYVVEVVNGQPELLLPEPIDALAPFR